MVIVWLEPSASATSCRARSVQTSVTAAVSSAGSGVIPDAPLLSSSTVSLVDMQPSLSTRSKLTLVASASWSRSGARVDHGVGGDHHQHRGQAGCEHRRPLGHAAHGPAVADGDGLLGHGVGGHDRLGRGATAVGGQVLHQGGDRGGDLVHRQPDADQPGGADGDVDRPDVVARPPAGRRPPARRSGACRRSRRDRCRRWPRRSSRSPPAGSGRRAPAGTTAPARPGPGCW